MCNTGFVIYLLLFACYYHCRPGPDIGTLSPMHIPDEEEEVTEHDYHAAQEMLGLARATSSAP